MCFNIASNRNKKVLEARYQAEFFPVKFEPQFSVSGFLYPDVPVISSDATKKIDLVQWGLIPSWVKSAQQANELRPQTLNARGETLFEKPSFRNSAGPRKCCILVNGFFEWQTQGKNKIPYFIFMKNQESFAFGGIWDEWKNPETNKVLRTFSIVTTEANPLMAEIHNAKKRMPLILQPGQEQDWLNTHDETGTKHLIRAIDENLLSAHPVSKLVNGRSGNPNVPEVQEAVQATPIQGSLF